MINEPIETDKKVCISNCIHKFWNIPEDVEIKDKDARYENCLVECEICE